MKFYSGSNRARWWDVNCAQQEILKVKSEKPDYSTRQFLSPTHHLMHGRKVALYLPHTLAVLCSIGRPIGIFDYLESSFISDLKPVAYQWRIRIAAVDHDFL